MKKRVVLVSLLVLFVVGLIFVATSLGSGRRLSIVVPLSSDIIFLDDVVDVTNSKRQNGDLSQETFVITIGEGEALNVYFQKYTGDNVESVTGGGYVRPDQPITGDLYNLGKVDGRSLYRSVSIDGDDVLVNYGIETSTSTFTYQMDIFDYGNDWSEVIILGELNNGDYVEEEIAKLDSIVVRILAKSEST